MVKTTSPLVIGVMLDPKDVALNSSPELKRSEAGTVLLGKLVKAGLKKGVFERVAKVRLKRVILLLFRGVNLKNVLSKDLIKRILVRKYSLGQ